MKIQILIMFHLNLNNVESLALFLNPISIKKVVDLAYHNHGVCFKPYMALRRMQTLLGLFGSLKPPGCFIKIVFLMSLIRKAL